MAPTKTGFFKNEECPASTELLDFQNGEVARIRGGEISRHLGVCEFCEAEIGFYSSYPQVPEENVPDTTAAQIPPPLFQLAEALLRKRHSDDSLNSLLRGRGRRVSSNLA